jgi:altronate dehydratase
MDNEWNEVFRRNTLKKIKQKEKYEILNPNKKPHKYIKVEYKEITKKDCTLTNAEKSLIEAVYNIESKKENSRFIVNCDCCSSNIISDIIKRPFFHAVHVIVAQVMIHILMTLWQELHVMQNSHIIIQSIITLRIMIFLIIFNINRIFITI